MGNITKEHHELAKRLLPIVNTSNNKNCCINILDKKIGEWAHHQLTGHLSDLEKMHKKELNK